MCSTTHLWLHLTLLNLFDKHCFCLRIKKLTEMFVAALCGSLSSSAPAFSFFRSKFVFISGVVIISFCREKLRFRLLCNYHNSNVKVANGKGKHFLVEVEDDGAGEMEEHHLPGHDDGVKVGTPKPRNLSHVPSPAPPPSNSGVPSPAPPINVPTPAPAPSRVVKTTTPRAGPSRKGNDYGVSRGLYLC